MDYLNFDGYADFIENTEVSIKIVVKLFKDKMYMEYVYENWRYEVKMVSNDGIRYSGAFVATKGTETDRGSVSGTVYTAEDQKLIFGRWNEAGVVSRFYVHLP